MSKSDRKSRREAGRLGELEVTPVHPGLARAHLALAAVAFAMSAYLTYVHFQLHRLAAWSSLCNVSATMSCDAVALSPYGTLMGLPLAAWGAWFYLATAAGTAMTLRGWCVVRSPALFLTAAAFFSVALSAVLAWISASALGAWCPVCIALYGLNAGMLATSLLMLRRSGEGIAEAMRAEWRVVRRTRQNVIRAAGAGLTVLVGLGAAYPSGFAPVGGVCKFLAERSGDRAPLAPAAIVVYSDFQCPHCRTAHRLLEKAAANPRVRVEHRHFPLEVGCNPEVMKTLHPGACLQAAAAECAEEQGRADAYAREVFEGRVQGREALIALSSKLGLEMAAFEACLASGRPEKNIGADVEAAARAGVDGTPAVFVEGRRIKGPLDQQDLSCLAP